MLFCNERLFGGKKGPSGYVKCGMTIKVAKVATFEMGLESNFFESVVDPSTNSPLTNPVQI